MTKDELERFRKLLVARRAALQKDVAALEGQSLRRDQGGALSHVPRHIADASLEASDQDVNLHLLAGEGHELAMVEEALARIEDGSYGLCQECDSPIPPRRLELLPHCRCCVPCQEQDDRRRVG